MISLNIIMIKYKTIIKLNYNKEQKYKINMLSNLILNNIIAIKKFKINKCKLQTLIVHYYNHQLLI